MSHGPPYGAGDFIPGGTPKQVSKYGNYSSGRVGDRTLTQAISDKRPSTVVCGHIHEDRGLHHIGDAAVYNVAAVDEFYMLHKNLWTRINL